MATLNSHQQRFLTRLAHYARRTDAARVALKAQVTSAISALTSPRNSKVERIAIKLSRRR
jgi:hypothetical protein